tara:strand:- start:18651 stop:22337 length:3687 start_codon:yes stop_codon:yes gene_type:complete
MTEAYKGSIFDLLGDSKKVGTAITVPNKKVYTGSIPDLLNKKDSKEDEIFESTIPENKKLKIEDFYRPSNLNTIREYMARHKGEEYRTTKDDSKLVDDFVDHMRWFNTNTLSLAGEVQFVRKGSDADRAAAADAYRLYDNLGNLFNRGETLGGKIDGIKDYIFAAAVDPSNYIGLLTGGLGKAATLGVTETSKKALKAVTKQAYKEAVKKGASSQAVAKAVTEAQESLIKKLGKDAVKSGAGKVALDHAAMNARREALRTIGMGAVRDIEKKRRLKGVAAELGGTFTADATIAAFQDLAIQDIYLDVNVDDSVTAINKKQVLLNGLIGGAVAPAFSLAGSGARKFVGGSSLGDATREMALKKFATKGTVDAGVSFEATKVIRDGYKSWAKKVEAGKEIRGNQMMPEGLLGEILLGPDKETGLVGFLRSKGITVNKDTFISDFLTDVIRVMPDEEFLAISKDFEKATGLPLGDVATAKVKLSDVIASYSSGLGRELSVFAQAKNKLNAGVVMGNDIINQSLERKEIRDALEDGLPGYLSREVQPKTLMYLQNVWRRTLVSSVPTTAANVFGWSQYYLGQAVADSLNGGLFYAYGVLRGNTEAGREARRVGQVYFQVQGAKFRNLLDPFTTHDAYMKFLDENKDIKSLIHETAGGTGVELSASKFDINPDSKVYKTIERYVAAATYITGVRAQDTFTKSQMFMTELDKHLRIKKGIKLADAMRDNNLNVIDEDIAGLAMDSTMKSVFSKDYTTVEQAPAIRSAAKFVESISNLPVLGSVLPFGRFFNNTIATVYQLGPWSLLPATAKIMRGRGDIQTMEAFSRAAVGTAGLIMAARMDQERQDRGLEATELDVGGGTIIDIKNAFPMSEFMSMGRLVNQLGKQGSIFGIDLPGKPAEPTIEKDTLPYYATTTPEAIQDMLVQIGVGQFARDIQFGNDMNRILNMFFDETNGEAGVAELQRRGGSFLAGFTRPFQILDKAVGFIFDTDIHKDKRQKAVVNDQGEVELVARTGGDIFSLEATRYVDNMLDIFRDTNEENDFTNLRVATRGGDLYDPNPLNSIFGVKVVPSKTASEKVYTMAGLKGFTASRRSGVAMYDRLLNETVSPILERKARKLLSDKKFMQGTNTYRRKEVKKILKQTRNAVNEAMPYLSRHHKQNKHKYDVMNYAGDGEQFKNAKKLFHDMRLEKLRDEGATEEELKKLKMKTPLDMNESELNQFKAILSYYREMKKE